MPDASSARAFASMRLRSVVKSIRRLPSTTASASPHRRAVSRTMAGIVGHVTVLRITASSDGHVARERDAVHAARLALVVVDRVVHRAPVVPQRKGTDVPPEPTCEL